MKLHVFEARTANLTYGNWGKFCVGIPGGDEWQWRSALPADPGEPPPGRWPLLRQIGWEPKHIWVWDLQTGEGAIFRHGGDATHDLNKHRIWVCPLFEPFLEWLYRQDLARIGELDQLVELEAEFAFHGYRRPGMWFDRPTGSLRVVPGGRGMCVGMCFHARHTDTTPTSQHAALTSRPASSMVEGRQHAARF